MSRILVIDDSRSWLLISGGSSRTTATRWSALQLRRTAPRDAPVDPEVAFLDIEMPGLYGGRVGEFVPRFEARRTRVIVYSSRPLEQLDAVAEKVDADAVLQKGATAERIRAVVAVLCKDTIALERRDDT